MTAPETARDRIIADLPPKRIIIFDMGQVFVTFTPQTHNPELLGNCRGTQEDLIRFFHGEPWAKYECGLITNNQIYEQAVSELGYRLDYQEFERDMCRTFELDKNMFEFLNDLKMHTARTQLQFWMLSNINDIHHRHVAERWPGLFSSFLHVFLSYEMGCRKPDREIFERMLNVGQARPEECIFVDDMETNGEGAKAVGMHFIKFESLPQLRRDLAKFGPLFEIPA
ncbi:MAG: HAD family phosphatase [bacterium]|nr:HAD family phosphatase [bacterium]